MALLSAAAIGALRALALEAMPDRCTVERATEVSDGQGGWLPTWAPLATGVPCRLRRPATGTEAEVAGRLAGEVAFVVMVPAGQDVLPSDRLRVTSTAPPTLLQARAVLAPLSDEVVRNVLCGLET
jgi:predicted outer membrane lipoprotein